MYDVWNVSMWCCVLMKELCSWHNGLIPAYSLDKIYFAHFAGPLMYRFFSGHKTIDEMIAIF